MRSGRSLHASNSDCNFVQSGTYCRPFRKLDGDEPAIEKSERRRVGVRIQIVLLLMGSEPLGRSDFPKVLVCNSFHQLLRSRVVDGRWSRVLLLPRDARSIGKAERGPAIVWHPAVIQTHALQVDVWLSPSDLEAVDRRIGYLERLQSSLV